MIYINSGVAKLGTDAWVAGSAEYYIARGKSFGTTGLLEPVMLWFTATPIGTASITWGTILLECLLGVLVIGTARMRSLGLLLGALLHVGIIASIGLWSFGLIMIGSLCIVASTDDATSMSRFARSRKFVFRQVLGRRRQQFTSTQHAKL